MIRIWRLSEAGPDNLGLACTDEGLVLGRTPLIERRDGRFAVRERVDVERLLKRVYGTEASAGRLMSGLATVASALNAKDPCLARIAAVHPKIPDLPNAAARDRIEAEDNLIKFARRQRLAVEYELGIRKASPDDPKHPGWPAKTPGGRGGKFRPKDGADAALGQEVWNRIARDALRTGLVAALHVGIESLANLVPGLDVPADVAMSADIARTTAGYSKLAIDAAVALEFVNDGPHSLEDLRVSSSDYEEFSSYGAFVKGDVTPQRMAKRFGGAGVGNQYHHIVTQGGANAASNNIPPEQLQNTENIIRLPTLLHEIVTDEYLGPSPVDPNVTLYQWLQTQPYEVQREYGLRILRELHILK